MATLGQYQRNLAKIANREALELLLLESVKETEHIALSLQKNQLNDGYNSDGKDLGVYSEGTENWKRDYTPRKPKIAGQHYNFEDTGDFFDAMELVYEQNDAIFTSLDPKTPLLLDKYGDSLLGLDKENHKNYILNAVLPVWAKKIQSLLN